mmetsp:Transcript_39060/g.112224  ORF Transcript_39060/g.112224 Transcript_39060/m.112224 type:complete len:249 (-) Transcript_39060:390-1136(-)
MSTRLFRRRAATTRMSRRRYRLRLHPLERGSHLGCAQRCRRVAVSVLYRSLSRRRRRQTPKAQPTTRTASGSPAQASEASPTLRRPRCWRPLQRRLKPKWRPKIRSPRRDSLPMPWRSPIRGPHSSSSLLARRRPRRCRKGRPPGHPPGVRRRQSHPTAPLAKRRQRRFHRPRRRRSRRMRTVADQVRPKLLLIRQNKHLPKPYWRRRRPSASRSRRKPQNAAPPRPRPGPPRDARASRGRSRRLLRL